MAFVCIMVINRRRLGRDNSKRNDDDDKCQKQQQHPVVLQSSIWLDSVSNWPRYHRASCTASQQLFHMPYVYARA